MRHPEPVKWADLAAGQLSPVEEMALETHAAACPECAGVRSRVARARASMGDIGAASPPALHDDLLGARVYWSAASELRRRERVRDGRRGWARRLVPVALAAGAVAGVVVLLAARRAAPAPAQAALASEPIPVELTPLPTPPSRAPAAPLIGVVTFLQGEVTLDGQPLTAETRLRPGARLVTGKAGRVAVQLGERSGFVVEPGARVELARFDERAVELELSGAVDVELEKRHADQTFVVRAGARAVEVRGTVFRVAEQAGEVDVAVTRGRVEVTGGGAVEVVAGARLAVAAAAPLATCSPRRLADAEAAVLARRVHVPMVSAWGSVDRESSLLTVSTPARARVRVDGVEVGSGSFVIRADPGRVRVEAEGASRWVDVQPGVAAGAILAGTSERPAQVDAELRAHRASIAHCGAAARKLDPEIAGVLKVEIGIEEDGSVGFVAPSQDLPAKLGDRDLESCLLTVIRDRFTFPAGSKATVQKKIHY